jgi:hypothetical protein
VDVTEIDDERQTFNADVFVQLRWKDSRLADARGGPGKRLLNLSGVWSPRWQVVNQRREQLAKTLMGIRGVKLTLEVDKVLDGEIRLDFTGSAESLRGVCKDLVLHAMQSMAASLDDLDSWKGSVEGNAFLLRGQLAEQVALARPAVRSFWHPLARISQMALSFRHGVCAFSPENPALAQATIPDPCGPPNKASSRSFRPLPP